MRLLRKQFGYKRMPLVLAFLLVVNIVTALALSGEVRAAADTPEKDRQRTLLLNFVSCISKTGDRNTSVIDTKKGHLVVWDDAIGDLMDDDIWVVGMDIDPGPKPGNGTLSCLDIIPRSINVLLARGVPIPVDTVSAGWNDNKMPIIESGSNEDEQKRLVTSWLTLYVTGQNLGYYNGQEEDNLNGFSNKVSQTTFESKLDILKGQANDALSAIGDETDTQKQARYIRLFNACYDSYAIHQGSGDRAYDEGKGDFDQHVFGDTINMPADFGVFFMLDRGDMKANVLTIVHDGGEENAGTSHHFRLHPDILLGDFDSFSEGNKTFNSKSSDWYPLGNDIDPSNKVDDNEGIADCGTFVDNPSVMASLFNGGPLAIEGKKLVFGQDNPNFGRDTENPSDVIFGQDVNDRPDCESHGGLTWLMCPIVNGLAKLTDEVYTNFVLPLLRYPNLNVKDEGTTVFQVWSSFRNMANIVIALALFIIVFAQAFGGGLIDAYTVKKTLPRLLVAVILANLSIYIVSLAVDATNVVGKGLGSLIKAPLDNADAFQYTIGQGTAGILLGIGIVALAAAIFTAFRDDVVPFLLIFIVLPAAMLMMSIMFTMVLRRGIILLLIMVAPVAFALYALPNTDKYTKKWWDLLFKTLLVYPIVVAIFAVSDVLAVTISAANDSNGFTGAASNVVADFASMIARLAPLFMIPFAFKLAGGVISQVANFADGQRGKGGGLLKKAKESLNKDMKERRNSGRAWRNAPEFRKSGKKTFRHRANRYVQDLSLIPGSGVKFSKYANPKNLAKPSNLRTAMAGARNIHATLELDHFKKAVDLNAKMDNDDFTNAALHGGRTWQSVFNYASTEMDYGDAAARQMADEVQLMQKKYGAEGIKAYAPTKLAGSRTTYRGGAAEMGADIIEAADGDQQLAATIYAQAKSAAEQAGRTDLSGYSYGEGLSIFKDIWASSDMVPAPAGSPPHIKTQRDAVAEGANKKLARLVIDSKGISALMQSHGTSAKNSSIAIQDYVKEKEAEYQSALATAKASPTDALARANLEKAASVRFQTLAEVANGLDVISYAAPENAREFQSRVLTMELFDGNGRPIEDEVEDRFPDGQVRNWVDVRVQKRDASGKPEYEADGVTPVIVIERQPAKIKRARILAKEIEDNRGNEIFMTRRRELNARDQTGRLNQMAQAGGAGGPTII